MVSVLLRIRDGAIPSQLPNCPSYLSSNVLIRESPEKRRTRLEETALQTALRESVRDEECHRKAREFSTLNQLQDKLSFVDLNYWDIVKKDDSFIICHMQQCPHPKISHSVVIKSDCSVFAYVGDAQVQHLGEYKIPSDIHDINDLDLLLNNLRNIDTQNQKTNPDGAVTIIQLVISLLSLIQDDSFKHLDTLKFVCEQLYLMTLEKFQYSAELLIFSSLFHNCSPQGYR